MTDIQVYQVGGSVRDELLGKRSKDLDFAVVAPSYEAMRAHVVETLRGRVFEEKPEYVTVRAQVPGLGAADYVLCRKESHYTDGRHPDSVTVGSLDDDLARRDFTMNAIAKLPDGTYYDPHRGVDDIRQRVLRAVGSPRDRFREDSLRILRALRFVVTHNLAMHSTIVQALTMKTVVERLSLVKIERVWEEMYRTLAVNTPRTLSLLEEFPLVREAVFTRGLWLKPSLDTPNRPQVHNPPADSARMDWLEIHRGITREDVDNHMKGIVHDEANR